MRSALVLCAVSALVLAGAARANAVECKARTSPMSPGDIAFSRAEYAKAEALYAVESRSGADADRAHDGLIRAELREAKIVDAEKDALAWSDSQPKNAWALTAVAEVRWREGRPDDALQILNDVRTMDYCNAQAHADLATVYRMQGMFASANRELKLARELDPVDDQIEFAWLRLQPAAARFAGITDLLRRDTNLSADQINGLEREKARALAPPVSSCHLVTAVTSTSIPFASIQNGSEAAPYWGLNVAFDGQDRRLKVDTGANGLILSKAAADALHLEPEATIKLGGIGDQGGVESFIAKVHSIKIGELEFQDCYVQVLTTTPGVMSTDDGLIGGDVFAHFLLTLDFPGRVLRLDPLPERPGDIATGALTLDTGVAAAFAEPQDAFRDASMKDWDSVWRSGDHLLMSVRLKPAGPSRLFLLDTGSSQDLISADVAREVAKVEKGSPMGVAGISGNVNQTWTTGPMKLYFSHFGAPVYHMVALDTSHMAGTSGVEISGIIGTPMLHQFALSIDYRDNLVHFSYDKKRLPRCKAGVKTADCY